MRPQLLITVCCNKAFQMQDRPCTSSGRKAVRHHCNSCHVFLCGVFYQCCHKSSMTDKLSVLTLPAYDLPVQVVVLLHVLALSKVAHGAKAGQPLVINTWPFVRATETAWVALNNNAAKNAALDAVEQVLQPFTHTGLLSLSFADKTDRCKGKSRHK